MRQVVILIIVVLTSCESPKQDQSRSSQLFGMDSLINMQIDQLVEVNAQLIKTVIYNGVKEVVNLNKAEVIWSNELAGFRMLDINKPSLFDAYKKLDGIKDSMSNLTIMSFQLNDDEINSVKMLNFYYLNDMTSLKRITGTIASESMLNGSIRKLELNFDQKQEQTVLTNYSHSIQEKRLFQEPVEVRIEGEVLY
jgi:hypothetical protein